MNLDKVISTESATRAKNLDPAQKLKLQKAVREFESVFVGYMLKSMRNTIEKADNSNEGFGADMLEGMFDVEFARHVSRNSNLGLANMLYRKMTGESLPGAGSQAMAERAKTDTTASAKNLFVRPDADAPAERAKLVQHVPAKTDAVRATVVPARSRTEQAPSSLQQRLEHFDEIIADASREHGVDSALIKAVIATESGARPSVKSPKDAKGLMQLIDSTAADMGVKNVWDPKDNINGGAKYLRRLLDAFDGDTTLALASYNAGPGNVRKYGGVPPFRETREYVNRVLNFVKLFGQEENNND